MFEDMNAFAIVVEQSSLNRASKLLNLSQPALSRKIAKLESELGVTLFDRRGKRLELTSVGQITYTFALEQRRRQSQFLQTLSQFKSELPRSLTLGASLTTLQTTLPSLMNEFMERHPQTEMKLLTGKTLEIVSSVRDKKVDVGLIGSYIDEPGLVCIPLFDDHLELVIPQSHPFVSRSRQARLEELQGQPMIMFSKGTLYRRMTDDLFQRFGVMPDIRTEIDSFEAIVRLLPIFKASALLPKSYLRGQLLRDNELVSFHIPELEQTRRTTCLIYDDTVEHSPTALYWITETQQSFAAIHSTS
ncbi:LysR family transcriptional regulator [Paenibacillus sp. JX-17]|uniref:LysR family transcriptional regulator n=1 Tax=Paenibacillus lacisoli TaxID=3064525 RepID=A0ABT9CCP2_9BACL|nr:LysR family transcriptional regulator [Paenibacillus sp. JX-17]MDO7907038.1 LysR family transcriptional regulator [Paenibacillus sp. JX-17]